MKIKLIESHTHEVNVELPCHFMVTEQNKVIFAKIHGSEENPRMDKITRYEDGTYLAAFGVPVADYITSVGKIIEVKEYLAAFDRFFDFVDDELRNLVSLSEVETEEDDLFEMELLRDENHAANRADDLNDDRKLREAV